MNALVDIEGAHRSSETCGTTETDEAQFDVRLPWNTYMTFDMWLDHICGKAGWSPPSSGVRARLGGTSSMYYGEFRIGLDYEKDQYCFCAQKTKPRLWTL